MGNKNTQTNKRKLVKSKREIKLWLRKIKQLFRVEKTLLMKNCKKPTKTNLLTLNKQNQIVSTLFKKIEPKIIMCLKLIGLCVGYISAFVCRLSLHLKPIMKVFVVVKLSMC